MSAREDIRAVRFHKCSVSDLFARMAAVDTSKTDAGMSKMLSFVFEADLAQVAEDSIHPCNDIIVRVLVWKTVTTFHEGLKVHVGHVWEKCFAGCK